MPLVPVGTTGPSLLSTRYGFHFFAGLSFGFFGGEDKFKGVYTAAAKTKAPSPPRAAGSEQGSETTFAVVAGSASPEGGLRDVAVADMKTKVKRLLSEKVDPATIASYVRRHLAGVLSDSDIAEWKKENIPDEIIRAAIEAGTSGGK
jgi:hypothetical protein